MVTAGWGRGNPMTWTWLGGRLFCVFPFVPFEFCIRCEQHLFQKYLNILKALQGLFPAPWLPPPPSWILRRDPGRTWMCHSGRRRRTQMRTGSSEEGRNGGSTHRCQSLPAALSAQPPSGVPAHGWPRSGSLVAFSLQGMDTSLWLPTLLGQ